MKKMKWFNLSILLLVGFFLFSGCNDTEMMMGPVIDSFFDSESVSGYTGVLHRVGSVENFGLNVNDPIALEWNGTDLYMNAEQGFYPNEGEYLFQVDRYTGQAAMVNRGARDFGGSFVQGRTFTQVYGVSPRDFAWISEGDGQMFGVCLVLDAVVSIDIDSGFAGSVGGELSYCMEDREMIPQPFAFGFDGIDFWMVASANLHGRKVSELIRVSRDFECTFLIGEVPGLPISMCWSGENMYVSETYTSSLCVLDLETGELSPVGKWIYSELPPGYYIQDKNTGLDSGLTQMPTTHDGRNYHYVHIARNVGFDFPDITGIAFDGQDMYAVDYFTDALYRVGRN